MQERRRRLVAVRPEAKPDARTVADSWDDSIPATIPYSLAFRIPDAVTFADASIFPFAQPCADPLAIGDLRVQASGKVGPRKTGNKLQSLDRTGGKRRKRTHSRRKPLR